MKIAVVGINYYPEVTGIGSYTTGMCEYLASKGHEVTVFTAFPYYPFGSDFSTWRRAKKIRPFDPFFNETLNGVKIKRCRQYSPKKPSVLKRLLHESSFVFLALVMALSSREKYDLIISVSPPILLGPVAAFFSRLKKAPYILHVQDLVVDAVKELHMIRNRAVLSMLERLELFTYAKADLVTTISESMRSAIIAKGVSGDKVGLLLNWTNAKNTKPADRINPFSREYSLNDKFVVLHAGNMGEKQDMEIILKAAEKMTEDDSVIFLLVGRGSKRAYVESYIKWHGLKNVLILDVQPEGKANELFSSCDAALITQDGDIRNCVMPSKIFGPCCAGKPAIIAAHESCEICRLAETSRFGLLVPPGDADALMKAIERLKADRTLARNLGANGRNFMLQERNMEKILGNFEKDIIMGGIVNTCSAR